MMLKCPVASWFIEHIKLKIIFYLWGGFFKFMILISIIIKSIMIRRKPVLIPVSSIQGDLRVYYTVHIYLLDQYEIINNATPPNR